MRTSKSFTTVYPFFRNFYPSLTQQQLQALLTLYPPFERPQSPHGRVLVVLPSLFNPSDGPPSLAQLMAQVTAQEANTSGKSTAHWSGSGDITDLMLTIIRPNTARAKLFHKIILTPSTGSAGRTTNATSLLTSSDSKATQCKGTLNGVHFNTLDQNTGACIELVKERNTFGHTETTRTKLLPLCVLRCLCVKTYLYCNLSSRFSDLQERVKQKRLKCASIMRATITSSSSSPPPPPWPSTSQTVEAVSQGNNLWCRLDDSVRQRQTASGYMMEPNID
ncbi:hypothetical protein JOB18_028530 [Solea senegalensis]|uniref:Uncharacterized protein n=1 Tax=Solea senegalensis TaxID=28829 RepID=A0AAV6T979_SOLSE|nr:hypothetical protein JOB18_028530 [Solea senegalensis]